MSLYHEFMFPPSPLVANYGLYCSNVIILFLCSFQIRQLNRESSVATPDADKGSGGCRETSSPPGDASVDHASPTPSGETIDNDVSCSTTLGLDEDDVIRVTERSQDDAMSSATYAIGQ